MKTAVYDNPATMHREAWCDGKLVASISSTLMAAKGCRETVRVPFMLNCGEWETGRIIGDAAAIRPPVA